MRSAGSWVWGAGGLPGLLHDAISEVRVARVHHLQLRACQIQELRAILLVERCYFLEFEADLYLRLIASCITQFKAQGPFRTCNESNDEYE